MRLLGTIERKQKFKTSHTKLNKKKSLTVEFYNENISII